LHEGGRKSKGFKILKCEVTKHFINAGSASKWTE